jgi:hypothetical protein
MVRDGDFAKVFTDQKIISDRSRMTRPEVARIL